MEDIKQELFFADSAFGSPIDAEDVGETVASLASDAGYRITAQDINVDAGTIWS